MANAGVTQEIRQRLTGHASKAINDHYYTHSELERLRRAVDAIPGLEKLIIVLLRKRELDLWASGGNTRLDQHSERDHQ